MFKIMEIPLNFLLLGYTYVWKTKIFNHYIEKEDIERNIATVGINVDTTRIKLNEKTLKLKIWDTGGEERYFNITQSYMKNQDIFILIYDITNRYSFEYIIEDINTIHSIKNKEDIILGIVGNKNDLHEERKVKFEEGRKLDEDNNYIFFEIYDKD